MSPQRTFFGRPPFAPLARAASALASDVTLPPFRPSATAAGFLRGTALQEHEEGGGVASVHLFAKGLLVGLRRAEAVDGGEGVCFLCLSHRPIKPYRLGYVK